MPSAGSSRTSKRARSAVLAPTDAGYPRSMALFGQEHVERYQETDGAEGHAWRGTVTLLLTTTGRKSGFLRTTPLIYQPYGEAYLIVASKGGAPQPPEWCRVRSIRRGIFSSL